MEKLVSQKITTKLQRVFSFWRSPREWAGDWLLKAVSVLLAVFLWYYVGGEDIVDKNVTVPIEIINLPRELVVSNQFKKAIEVTVSGPRSRIEELVNKSVTRQINLADARPGTNVIENTNDVIAVPKGVTVLRIQPASLILSLDKLVQRQFPIIPITTGEAAWGYTLKNMKMDPDSISITGPETILNQIDELLTDVIDISGMTETRQLQVPLNLDAAIVDLIGETSVTAEIVIHPQVQMKKLKDVPVDVVRSHLEGVMFSPETVEVIANFPLLLLAENEEPKDLFAVVALSPDETGQRRLTVVSRDMDSLPIEILSITPETIQVVLPKPDLEQPAVPTVAPETAVKEEAVTE